MGHEIMNRHRLEEILGKFPAHRIAVVGDFFLDKWLEIDRSLDELSLETNITAYQVVAKRCYAGAAGTVLSDLASLDVGELYALGFAGDDGEAYEMFRVLKTKGVNIEHLHTSADVMTPTYTKPVFRRGKGLEETHRLDHKNTRPTPPHLERKVIDSIREIIPRVDAIIALDQLTSEGYGVLTPKVREELAKVGGNFPNLVLYADSRAFISRFQNMVIKCNNIEAVKLFAPPEAGKGVQAGSGVTGDNAFDLEEVKQCLLRLSQSRSRPVFISCGSRGVMALDKEGAPVLVPAVELPPETEIDIVGAGDACSAGIVTTLCSGGTPEEAAFVGNLVASNTIQVIGTTGTATRQQLLKTYDTYFGKS